MESIERNDARSMSEQEAAVLQMFEERGLAEEDARRIRNALTYFRQCMGAYHGWGDDYLLKPAKSLVETLNEVHKANDNFITDGLATSLQNLLWNHLIAGEYSEREQDPTAPWRKW